MTGPDLKRRSIFRRRRTLPALLLLALAMVTAISCNADNIPRMTADELKELLASHQTFVIVDTRSESEYARGHVPKAILIPEQKSAFADRFLPSDTDKEKTTVVFYCRGGG